MSGTGCGTGCRPFRRPPRTTPARRCHGKRRRPAPGPVPPGRPTDHGLRFSAEGAGRGLAEVDELQRQAELVAFYQGYHGLQVVLLLRGHAELVALHLGADALGPLVPDQLGDLPRVVLGDALLEADGEPELLTGWLRVAGVQRLERDAPPDQFVLEHVQDGLGPVLAVGADLDKLPGPGDRGAHPAEVEPRTDLLGRLVQGIIDLLLVDPADDVEE